MIACCVPVLAAQPADDTQLRQVIIVSRHGVRTPLQPNSALDVFSAAPYPELTDPVSYLTANGTRLETMLGTYYRLWLKREGLLTGQDSSDAAFVYFRALNLERTVATAQAFAAALLPSAAVNVDFQRTGSDPLFDPVGAGISPMDYQKAAAAVSGRIGNDPQAFASGWASELSLARATLFQYPASRIPLPATPAGKIDATALPMTATAGDPGNWPVVLGGLSATENAVSPFFMQYADGLPASAVAWGQLSLAGIGQTMRLTTLVLDLECRTPYLDRVQSSNLASHVVRSIAQAATGTATAGSLASPSTRVIVLVASDVNVAGLAGLFHLNWLVPGYPADFCAPGGALVFELRQSQRTGEFVVRASYVAQTPDQLRNRSAMTLDKPPATAPLFIPGCSTGDPTFDCPLADFVRVANGAMDPSSADLVH